MNHIWNPRKSDQLQKTIDSLVEIIQKEDVKEINPSFLMGMGGDYEKMYHCAFHTKYRPLWAQEEFPETPDDKSGFESFVVKLRQKVGPITNSRRPISALANSELQLVLDLRSTFEEGEIDLESAMKRLDKEGIRLSEFQKKKYFGAMQMRGLDECSSSNLALRLRQKQKELGLDFTDIDCLKGLLFESLVGCYLVNLYGRQSVSSQVRMGVRYKDLEGFQHREVFADFIVDGQIYEVKWKNSFENIITSVLPQLHALEFAYSSRSRITVICRHKDPQTLTSYASNVSLESEAAAMNIPRVGRSIRNVMGYVSLTELVSEHEDPVRKMMRAIDSSVEKGDVSLLKRYYDSMSQIYLNGERIAEKLETLRQLMFDNSAVLNGEIVSMFGESTTKEDETKGSEDRIRIVKRVRESKERRAVLEMYNLHFQTDHQSLTEYMVRELDSLSGEQIDALVGRVVARREEKYLTREQRRRGNRAVTISSSLDSHILACESMAAEEDRALMMLCELSQGEQEGLSVMYESVKDIVKREAHRSPQQIGAAYTAAYELLVKHKLFSKSKTNFANGIQKRLDLLTEICNARNIFSKGTVYLGRGLVNYTKLLEDIFFETTDKTADKTIHEFLKLRRKYEGLPVSEAFNRAAKKIKSGKISCSEAVKGYIVDPAAAFFVREAMDVPNAVKRLVDMARGLSVIRTGLGGSFLRKIFCECANDGDLRLNRLYEAARIHLSLLHYQTQQEMSLRGYTLDHVDEICSGRFDMGSFLAKVAQGVADVYGKFYSINPEFNDFPLLSKDFVNLDSLLGQMRYTNAAHPSQADLFNNFYGISHAIHDFSPLRPVSRKFAKFVRDKGLPIGDQDSYQIAIDTDLQGLCGAMHEINCVQRYLFNDIYMQRTLRMRVIAEMDVKKGLDYFYGFDFKISSGTLPLEEFAKYAGEKMEQDDALFRRYYALLE